MRMKAIAFFDTKPYGRAVVEDLVARVSGRCQKHH